MQHTLGGETLERREAENERDKYVEAGPPAAWGLMPPEFRVLSLAISLFIFFSRVCFLLFTGGEYVKCPRESAGR